MYRISTLLAILLLCTSATLSMAQDGSPMHHKHMAMSVPDGRELLHFPPEMQAHMLRNMRDHMQTLNGVVEALARGDYAGASKLADEHLGLGSPSAAGCKPKGAEEKAEQGSMDEMMAMYMPEPMRNIGLSMHTAASDFARVTTSHDRATALAALSKVTQNCVACHSAYRLR